MDNYGFLLNVRILSFFPFNEIIILNNEYILRVCSSSINTIKFHET